MQLTQRCQPGELILCGWDEVFILDVGALAGGNPEKLWSWRAKGRQDLPHHLSDTFHTTDECKPVDGGRRMLITSSGGGAALVDRRTGGVCFCARVENAHSGDLLPAGRVAIAASHAPAGGGDRLVVFDLRGQELCSDELPWAHGVVWDEHRQLLWALSHIDIRAYRLQNRDSASPKLVRTAAFELPEGGGHDLYPVPGSAMLSVSTSERCWLFNRDGLDFQPHPDLADLPAVKSIAVHPATGQVAYIQAEGEHWWSESVHFLHPRRTLHLPGEHLYKARWDLEVR